VLNINQLIIEGNISCNPELRHTATGKKPVTNFYIYVDSKYRNKNGTDPAFIKNTSKVPVVAWGGKAEYISNTFGKGDKVRLVGHIKTKEITTKDRKIVTFEVIAKDLYLIKKNLKSSD
jgi:single-stranded DNA-binding protein